MKARDHVRLRQLGDLLGSLHYMGSCPACGRQHMSTHAYVLAADKVSYPGHGYLCERCAIAVARLQGKEVTYA